MQIVCQFLTISHNYEGNFCNFMTKTNFNKTKVLKKYQFSSWKTSKLHMQLIKLSVYLFAILYYLLKFLGILTEVIINSSSSPCLSLFLILLFKCFSYPFLLRWWDDFPSQHSILLLSLMGASLWVLTVAHLIIMETEFHWIFFF